jgi:hypothetical protein
MLNVKVIKFLLANQAALLQIVEIAKKWSRDMPAMQQWALVDQIAHIVIPMWEAQAVSAQGLLDHAFLDESYDPESYGPALLSFGADFTAMGIDWKLIVDVILPLVISILQALEAGARK